MTQVYKKNHTPPILSFISQNAKPPTQPLPPTPHSPQAGGKRLSQQWGLLAGYMFVDHAIAHAVSLTVDSFLTTHVQTDESAFDSWRYRRGVHYVTQAKLLASWIDSLVYMVVFYSAIDIVCFGILAEVCITFHMTRKYTIARQERGELLLQDSMV